MRQAGNSPGNAVLRVRRAESGRPVGGIPGAEPGSAEVKGGGERAPVLAVASPVHPGVLRLGQQACDGVSAEA